MLNKCFRASCLIGIEEHFAVNHVGHFLLTSLLMPALLKSEAPRVVNVSSDGYRSATGGEFKEMSGPSLTTIPADYSDYNFKHREYKWNQGYAQSKLVSSLSPLLDRADRFEGKHPLLTGARKARAHLILPTSRPDMGHESLLSHGP